MMEKTPHRMPTNGARLGIPRVLETLESRQCALKAGELAKLFGVTRQQIYKLAAAGAIPSFRVGSAVRFDPNQVADWLRRKLPEPVMLAHEDRLAV
jgi:excisionase family DNA binding protein